MMKNDLTNCTEEYEYMKDLIQNSIYMLDKLEMKITSEPEVLHLREIFDIRDELCKALSLFYTDEADSTDEF